MFNSLFEFFFKYSPYVFQQGEFRLAASSPTFVAVALAAVIALATVLTYRTAPGDASGLDRAVSITIYVSDMDYWGEVNNVYIRVMGSHKPARAVVPVKELHYGYALEIQCVAAV